MQDRGDNEAKIIENMTMTTKTVIVDGLRTPFIKAGSDFKDVKPDLLAALAIKEMMQRMSLWDLPVSKIGCVIGSNVATPVHAPNIARVAAVKAGLPESIPAQTLNQNCGSGIAAVDYGVNLINIGRYQAVIVVGVESMSQIPLVYSDAVKNTFERLSQARTTKDKFRILWKLYPQLFRFWDKRYRPRVGLLLGLTDPICDLIMGLTAENLAKDPCFGITRQDQDIFAARSHQRAADAQKNGIFAKEIANLYVPSRGKSNYVDSDNGIRSASTTEVLAKIKPYFDKRYGSVTVGNSSQITDGASCILLMERGWAKAYGLPTLGYATEYEQIGFDPTRMGLAPAGAIARLLQRTKLELKDFSTIEINEAFAAQVLACTKTLASDSLMKRWFGSYGFEKAIGEISDKQLNPNGGAIALGHPVGVSGMRLIITALKELKRNKGEKALVSACIGGGQANAMILERSGR